MSLKSVLAVSLLFFSQLLYCQNIRGIYKIDDLQKRISHPDTIYVVNFWAMWCKPCIEELPSFDSLNVSLMNQPVKVLLVSVDFLEDQKKVNAFLEKKKIRTECVLLDEINGNNYINTISTKWSGTIPATYFKKGQQSILYEKKFNSKSLLETITRLK